MQTVQVSTLSAPLVAPVPARLRSQPAPSSSASLGWIKNALSIIALVGLITAVTIPAPWWVAVLLFALMLAPHVNTGQAVEEQRRRHLIV